MLKNTLCAAALGLSMAAAPAVTYAAENPIFGDSKHQALSTDQASKVVGQGYYADYYGYYGMLYSYYAYYYGYYGYYYDTYSQESTYYYYAYLYAYYAMYNYYYAYYYAGS